LSAGHTSSAAAPALVSIPDVGATVSSPSLRYVELNRQINRGYGVFGQRFQAILDPSFARTSASDVYPSWFAFAAFASRAIGQAQLGAEVGLNTARYYKESGQHRTALAQVLPPALVPPAVALVDTLLHEQARLAATFLIGFASTASHLGAFQGVNIPAMLELRTFRVSVERLLALLLGAPGANPLEHLGAVATTLRNMMEDGNRRIYGDIGGLGEKYLHLRKSWAGEITPDRVLNEFAPAISLPPNRPTQIYQLALQHSSDNPLPIQFDRLFSTGDSREMIVAAFALYEQARLTSDPATRNRYIAFANNLVIYREQHDAVQPAFTPAQVLPGEVDRLKLLAIITPTIEVIVRGGGWRFWQYAETKLPARNPNPLLAHATQYNWAVFEDRWAPVIDSFAPCYSNPQAMWPPPNPDPGQPI
jgi:hypothetical protein